MHYLQGRMRIKKSVKPYCMLEIILVCGLCGQKLLLGSSIESQSKMKKMTIWFIF